MCEYCELKEPLDTWGEHIIDEELNLGAIGKLFLWNAVNCKNKQLTLAYMFNCDGDSFDVPIKYCPMCGRKLFSEEEHMTIGEKIRAIRKCKGMSCKKLAELIGTSEAYVRAYEKGRRYPKYKSLVKIAKALDVSMDTFSEIMLADANGKDGNNG